MMITGAHSIIYTTNAEADRAFFRDVLKFPYVDSGDGWLIFSLPPSEVAMHPSDKNDQHELYLLTHDVHAFVKEMQKQKMECSEVNDYGWGLVTQVTLPGGGKIGVYEARHKRP